MVAITEVRTSIEKLKLVQDHVSVFVGATSGIGEATLIQLVTYIDAPKVYLVGRSKAKLSKLRSELQNINSKAKIEIVEAETSLLKKVDAACKEITQKESKIDLLYLTTGYLSFERVFTSEGLDQAASVKHYSRIRFVQNLLPLLKKAPAPRVVSVLAGGQEGKLFTSDLDLKDNHSFTNDLGHFTTMHTLSLEELAKNNPSISFLHAYPGFVDTGIIGRLLGTANGGFTYYLAQIAQFFLVPIVNYFSIPIQQVGQRGLFHATSPKYPSRQMIEELKAGGALDGGSLMKCSAGDNGVYRVREKGETVDDDKVLGVYRKDGVDSKVWDHNLEVFDVASRG